MFQFYDNCGKTYIMSTPDLPDEDLARRVEDGSYFRDARLWYDHLYIGPISQRVFFIIVSGFAVLFFIMAILAVTSLLPLSPRIPFVYRNDDFLVHIPNMQRFKAPGEEANPALIRYYLRTYVQMREGYNARRFNLNQKFVRHYSSTSEESEYVQSISRSNPQSPLRRYGRESDVVVEVKRINYDREALPYRATIDFSTIVMSKEKQQKTDWTATIAFEYTDLTIRNRYDESIGDYVLDYDEPTFRVLSYEMRERLSRVR